MNPVQNQSSLGTRSGNGERPSVSEHGLMALPAESRQRINPFAVKVFRARLRKNRCWEFQNGRRKIEIYPQSFDVSYEEMTATALVLQNISQMVSPHLVVPHSIHVYLFDVDSNQPHAGGSEMIFSRVPKDKCQPDAALAHEAGHVIYQHNLWRRVVNDPRFTSEMRWAVQAELGNMELVSPHVLSFEELFSDLLAVLYARDGRAMVDHLAACPWLKEHHIQSRDFTRPEPAPYPDADVAPYGLPGTRFLIGQSCLTQTLQANNEGPFLRRMFDLLYEEFAGFHLGNHPAGSDFDRRADERLSRAVSKAMSEV